MAKIVIPKDVRRRMHRLAMKHVRRSADAIEAACLAESELGFYEAYHSDDASRVAALNAVDNARGNRLLRNIDRGRV